MESQSVPPQPSQPRARRAPVQEIGLVVVILIMWGILSIFGYINTSPGSPNIFLNRHNIIGQIATPMSYYAIMAVGMMLVVIAGGIDISVGSTMALSALGAAWILPMLPRDAPAYYVFPLVILSGPLIGLLCGLLNGALVVGLRMHPFIVTLGTLSIIRGMAIVMPPTATLPGAGQYLPSAFYEHFMGWQIFDIRPMPMIIMLVVVGIGWFYLSKTVGGREIYAVGGNEEAARFSGLRVGAIKLRVYALMGLTAGIAGTVSLGRFGTASTNTGQTYELMVIAAAVVGGGSLSGGRGTALGALLGTLVIATIEDGINVMHWPQEYRLIIIGWAIIIAVAVDRLSEFFRQRRLKSAGAKAATSKG